MMDAGEALVGAQSGGGLERGLTVAEAHSEGQEPGVVRPFRRGWKARQV